MDAIKLEHLCPVCGYNLFANEGFLAWVGDSASHEICSSCGIEFGYNDEYSAGGKFKTREENYNDWRNKWIDGGMLWNINTVSEPKDWDPQKQLEQLKKLENNPK